MLLLEQYVTSDDSENWIVLQEEYDVRGSGLINVIPPTEMAKVKIIPTEPVNEADEFFYFNVDFYACQQRKNISKYSLFATYCIVIDVVF